MSTNNNPHGHLNQSQAQTPSWNPLQIPSYIPRQPELAHMSNERRMVRSPLAWHAPPVAAAPPETLYNFMATANHKSLDHQMNPLLPAYVRGSSLFDSMDLSLPSARAPTTTTTNPTSSQLLNKTAIVGMPIVQQQQQQQQLDYGSKIQEQQLQQHPNQLLTNNYPFSPPQMSQQQQHQQQHHNMQSIASTNILTVTSTQNVVAGHTTRTTTSTTTNKYINNNGNDCEISTTTTSAISAAARTTTATAMTPPRIGNNTNSATNNNNSSNPLSAALSPVHYNIRDTTDTTALRSIEQQQQQMFSNKLLDIHRMNYEGEYSKCLQKSEDLVPKFVMSNKMQQQQHQQQQQVSPKKHSPLRNYHTHHQQQQQQQQQQQLSPYHNTTNLGGKRNGPHTPPNQSPTMLTTTKTIATGLTQHQEQILHGNGSGSSGGDGEGLHMNFNEMHSNNFIQSAAKQHQAPSSSSSSATTTTTPTSNFMSSQQQIIYQNQTHAPQQHQAQNQAPTPTFGMQLKHEQNSPSSTKQQNATCISTNEGSENAISDLSTVKSTPLRNRTDTSDSSSSSDDDDDDESIDSSNSNSNSQRSAEKSNEQKTHIRPPSCTESRSKDLSIKDNKEINTPPRPASNQSNHSAQKDASLAVKVNSPSTCSKSSLDRQNSNESVETSKTLADNGVPKIDTTNKINDNENDATTIDLTNNNNINNSNNNMHNNINCEYTRNLLNSPKTKKQRQVLKLRHAEHTNSNSNSNNSIMQNEIHNSGNSAAGADVCGGVSHENIDRVMVTTCNDDDNAVSVDELRTNATIGVTAGLTTAADTLITTITTATATTDRINCPLSPNSNSRSSSSSSSSSSCSNSSRTSCDSKSNHNNNNNNIKNPPTSRLQQLEKEHEEEDAPVQEPQTATEHSIEKMTSPTTTTNATTIMPPNEIKVHDQNLNNSSMVAETTTKINTNEDLEKKLEESNKDIQQSSRFEEVENKLEEMFAGIEDEISQGEIVTSGSASQPDDLNLALQLATRSNTPDLKEELKMPMPMPMPTKAAKKSTPPIHINTVTRISNNITDLTTTKTITTTTSITTTTTTITKEPLNTNTPTSIQTSATLAAKLALDSTLANTINTSIIPAALQSFTKTTATTSSATNLNLKRLRLPRRSSVGIALHDYNDDDKSFDPSIYLKNCNYKPMKTLLPPKQRKIEQHPTSSPQTTIATPDITHIKKTTTTTPVTNKIEEITINKNNSNNNNNNKNVNIVIDDEKPSTSAAALAAMAAATKENEKLLENHNNKKKQQTGGRKGKATAKGKNKASGKNTKATAAAATTTTTTGKQQQVKANRRGRKNSSDEDEASNSNTRDGTTVNSSSAGTAEVKYRSPFILLKGDGSVSVINTPTAEDAINEGKTVGRKTQAAKYAHDRKIRGLHSSTLSVKYDAETPDSTWICVFCKQGPHKMGLGDLFGPYLISSDCEEFRMAFRLPGTVNIDALFAVKRRRSDMVKTHPRNLPVVPALQQRTPPTPLTGATGTAGGRGKKRKKSMANESETLLKTPAQTALTTDALNLSESASMEPIDDIKTAEMLLGMTKVAEQSFEVWLHEDCAVWAPDVFLVGARVTGLDSTVWDSTLNECSLCAKTGATVCCLQRDCKIMAHAPCARNSGWSLDETNMCTHCQRHAIEQLGAKDRQLSIISDTLHYVHSIQSGCYMTDILKS